MTTNNTKLVPQSARALDQLKVEVAQELGVSFDPTGYNGNMTAREAGAVGGGMVRKLVQIAEQTLAGQSR
jgi:hypothetical protein